MRIRKLCPNVQKENGLETVLEVPIPEEMFAKMGRDAVVRWHNMRGLMKARFEPDKESKDKAGDDSGHHHHHHRLHSKSDSEFLALLKLVGAPFIPFQIHLGKIDLIRTPILNKQFSIEASSAKYIMGQYIAAMGGQPVLTAMKSMCAVGQVKMVSSAQGDETVATRPNVMDGGGEVGGFVLWQKNPNLWYLEFIVAGFKVSAGSDGKVSWNQCSSQPGHATRGPPRPLRRFFQGLDPRCTAELFSDAVCIGEKSINGDHCFVLKVETSSAALSAQSSANTEIVHHTIWGYFSHRTGLLIKLEDTRLVKMKPPRGPEESIFWEAMMESFIEDYQSVDGTSIAHGGTTITHLHRYAESGKFDHKIKIEEKWRIEEVDFNISGLSIDYFLPPADLKREQEVT